MEGADDAAGDRSRRRSSSWLGLMLTLLGTLLLIGAALGLLAHVVAVGPPILLGMVAMSPYAALVGSAGGLVVMLFAHRWIGTAIALVLLLGAVAVQTPLYVSTSAPRSGTDLVVLSSNLRLGAANARDVVDAARSHHADLVSLQELTPQAMDRLHAAGLDTLLPHRLVAPAAAGLGTGLWSRYPLSDAHEVPGFVFRMVAARPQVPGAAHAPTVLAVHMAGPVPDSTGWQHDMAAFPDVLRAQPRDAPVIVAGDFNATGDSVQFRRLLRVGYADAADQAGAGYTRTWPSGRWFPPLIAIDHVLTRDAVATSVDTIDIGGTDHRALLVTTRSPA